MNMEYDGKLDYLFHTANADSEFENLFFINKKAVDEKRSYSIEKAGFESNAFVVSDFSKIELADTEIQYQVFPRDKNSLLLMKFDYEKKAMKLEVLKSN